MLFELFLASRLLLASTPASLQPLSHFFGYRMPCSFLFQPSSFLLFPETPMFFLTQTPLLVLTAAVFFLLPHRLRLLTVALLLVHRSDRLSPLPGDL